MKFQAILGSALLALACSHTGAFAAADCRLKIVNTIPLTLTPDSSRVLVPVIINGTEKKFLLDTGGAATQISAAAAQELKLPPTEGQVKMIDLYGNASSAAVRAGTLTLGRLQDKNSTLPVMTDLGDGKLFVGILAADYMGNYDVELDFAGGKMNYFSREHCEGKVVYWPAAGVAVVPMRFWDHHLNLDVMLDGKPVRAVIDTGAPDTTLIAPEAKRLFGLTAESSGTKQIYEDRGEKAFEYVFQKLSFEGLEVNAPHVAIIPDKVGSRDANNDFVTGSRVHRVDDRDSSDPAMLVGMNILSKLRLYIAFSENKIYVTPAAPLPAAPAQ